MSEPEPAMALPKPVAQVVGRDLETGEPAEVRIAYDPSLEGPWLHWPGAPEGLPAHALAHLPRLSERRTVVLPPPASRTHSAPGTEPIPLRLCEHLFAALLFFPRLPLRLTAVTGALPLLDGSALPWRETLAAWSAGSAGSTGWAGTAGSAPIMGTAAAPDHGGTEPRQYASQLRLHWEWPGGHLIAEPAPGFSATYEIARNTYHNRYHLAAPAEAYAEVLPARTFIFAGDYHALREAGRLRGAEPDAGLLLDDSSSHLLHPAHYRFDAAGREWHDEPARHKMLDLLGDLALLGLALPRLKLHVRNAGHTHHHRLLEALIHERDAHPNAG